MLVGRNSYRFESIPRWLSYATLSLALGLTISLAPSSFAQKSPKTARKVVTYIKPAYPPMLKSMHIEGQVRLTAVVLPSGSVAAIEVRGGNPILVENAVKAVKTWKYAPGPAQTEEEVVLDFGAN
jgi:TonB family protein